MSTKEKGPSFDSTSNSSFRSNDVPYGNCCWCGSIMDGLKHDAKEYMNQAIRRYCSKCGKPNIISFHWSLTVEARPERHAK
jgi:hypothetical protein